MSKLDDKPITESFDLVANGAQYVMLAGLGYCSETQLNSSEIEKPDCGYLCTLLFKTDTCYNKELRSFFRN